MEKYCINLDLAKKLKENNFPQNTFYCYGYFDTLRGLAYQFTENNSFNKKIAKELYSAPTSDEILKELPYKIDTFFELYINKCGEESYVAEYTDFSECYRHNTKVAFDDLKLVNTLAKLYIWLKKEGYIK